MTDLTMDWELLDFRIELFKQMVSLPLSLSKSDSTLLAKVGPGGYIHGWIKVGPGAGSSVDEDANKITAKGETVHEPSAHDAAISAGAHATRLASRGSGATREDKIAAHDQAVQAYSRAAQSALDSKDTIRAKSYVNRANDYLDKRNKLLDAKSAASKPRKAK